MKTIALACCLFFVSGPLFLQAQDKSAAGSTATDSRHTVFHKKHAPHPRPGVYVAGGADGGILSFASVKENGSAVDWVPRFTLFFNIGSTVNYDFNNNFGMFSGINLKNIGLITKRDSLKLKQRVYTLGVPLGFKIGDLNKRVFVFFGGQYDLAFNYKEKKFINGDKKGKFNEWFSNRTPALMPSLFAGLEMGSFSIKMQYYPNDFFNRDYTQTVAGVKTQPYKDLQANVFFATLGYNFRPRH